MKKELKKEQKKEQKEQERMKDVTKIAGDSFAPYEKDDNGW